MNIDCKNCYTCKYYEEKFGGYNETTRCCTLGSFHMDKPKEYICDKYDENKKATELFMKENFKKINNFRNVNQNNSAFFKLGNSDLLIK